MYRITSMAKGCMYAVNKVQEGLFIDLDQPFLR